MSDQYDFIGRYDTNIEEFANNKELRNAVIDKLGQLEGLEEEAIYLDIKRYGKDWALNRGELE